MKHASAPPVLTHVTHDRREPRIKPLSMDLFRRLFRYTRAYAGRRNALLACVILRSIQLPLLAWAIGAVVGGPVSRMDVRGILWGAAGYALLAAITQFTMRYRSLLALQLGEDVVYDLRNEMFSHLQRQPMSFFNTTRIGRIISRFTSDAESIRSGVQDVVFVSLVQVGQMLVAAALMFYYDWLLFLVVVSIAAPLWAINRRFRLRLSKAYRDVQESFSRITATLAESVSGIRVTQGFVRQKVNAGMFNELVADHSQHNIDVAKAAGVFLPLLEFNTQLFVAIVLFIGGRRVLNGVAEVQDLYQFVLMANMFFSPIQSLGNQLMQALTSMAGAERVFRLLDTEPAWSDPPGARDAGDISGGIELRDVCFSYTPPNRVLHHIDLTITPGQTVALVGHTGSGKSSIINLIAKFYLPDSGQVLIDGMDIAELSGDALHHSMGIVLQQNFLFTGTVMDNIRMGKPSAGDEEIIEVTKKLDCLDLMESLADGFRTVVGERGSGISLGQRQLICFARAMLADPRIMILDEATSSVDMLTEERIQRALTVLLKNRTSLVVAHRLSTIRHADMVLVMHQGRIVERGTHMQLLAARGMYMELYQQFIRQSTRRDGDLPDNSRHSS